MALNDWSDAILIADPGDEPGFSEDMENLVRRLDKREEMPDVIVDLQRVTYLNSSNISDLLKVRKKLLDGGTRLRLCAIQDSVWSVMLATGLASVFEFTEDVATSLASLQIAD